jgi:hypothetical protein
MVTSHVLCSTVRSGDSVANDDVLDQVTVSGAGAQAITVNRQVAHTYRRGKMEMQSES